MLPRRLLGFFPILLLLILMLPAAGLQATGDVAVYTDSLGSGWQNWSWDTTINFNNSAPLQGGSASMAVTYSAAWAGVYLSHDTQIPAAGYEKLRFWLYGGSAGGQRIRLAIYDAPGHQAGSALVTAQANTWTLQEIPLTSLGSPTQVSGLVWQDDKGVVQPQFYLDAISLVAVPAGSTATQTMTPSVTPSPTNTQVPGSGPALLVDAGAGHHTISPYIYGMNFTSEDLATELHLPVRRWGGNAVTRYNWQNDTSNHASDWYFENIPEDNPNPATLPNGSAADQFVEQDRRTGTKTFMTLPLIGWTPKDRAVACGFSVQLYGSQQSTDPWQTDCGNGKHANGALISGNNPLDTSIAITPTFVTNWINHLTGRYGTADQGGVAFYNLDNEPMLWSDTHRDVHPLPLSYDELRDRTYQYAPAIRAADPTAKILGPTLYGWTAYFWSALDWSAGGAWWNNPLDRLAHGNTPFVAWYLQQMQAYEQQHGAIRILDYLDLHYYPQANGVSLSGAGSGATQALRLRSTRSLWDPTYTDESWIGEPVYLIPRMRDWVNTNYPGTKIAIGEYNWGALDAINGALAQADVLGIFGREGVDLATLWAPPTSGQPGAYAFRMYLNVDGAGNGFGDMGVSATSANQDTLSVYAALRSNTNVLTVMVVNKSTGSLSSTVNLSGFTPGGAATVYRYSSANLNAIQRLADQAVTVTGFSATFPQESITLFVIPPAAAGSTATPSQTATATRTGTVTSTPSRTPTLTPAATGTATNTASATRTATPTATRTGTATNSPTATGTSTATATATPTATVTQPAGVCYDLNGDHRVDAADIQLVLDHWHTTDSIYDFDHDGDVDIMDLMLVTTQWGRSCL